MIIKIFYNVSFSYAQALASARRINSGNSINNEHLYLTCISVLSNRNGNPFIQTILKNYLFQLKNMTPKIINFILPVVLTISCDSSTKTQTKSIDTTTKTIVLTDTSEAKLLNELSDIAKSNSSPDDITISVRFIKQGKYNNGDYYIAVKTNDSTLTLINPMPLKDNDIAKLKKDGNNITLTYNSSTKTVKFLAAEYENEK